MSLTLEQPLYLLIALIAAPIAWSALRFFSSMSLARRWSAVVARALLVLLIAGALAGASAVRTSDRLATILVVDVSGSMTEFASEFADLGADASARARRLYPTLRQWTDAVARDRGADDLLGLVVFDGGALAVATPSPRDEMALEFDYSVREGTDIAGALRFASTLFPPGARRRLVLISDGNTTGADPSAVARELRASGTRIDVIPVAYRVDREVMIEAVDVPPRAEEDATVAVRVVLSATEATTGTLDLLYEGRPIDINGAAPGAARRVSLDAGRTIEVIELPLSSERIVHRLEPVFTPDDGAADRIAANNRAETFTVTPGSGRVLIVDGTSESGGAGGSEPLLATLERAGIEAEAVPPALMPPDLLALQGYDLVVLQSVPIEDVPPLTQQALADYVQTLGGGLVMIGGPGSFGPGGWNESPLEPILPVELDLPDELIAPTAAVAIVLDSSGSMAQAVLGGSRSQQQIANDSAAHAVMTMDANDLICVIEFNSDWRVVWPMGKNAEPERTAQAIRNIAPGGGTSIAPALGAAFNRIKDVDAPIRHVILLSDGQDANSADVAPEMARRMADEGISVSTIAVGDDADWRTLDAIATAGTGSFYRVVDPNTLVSIFLKEIRVIRQPLIRLGRFTPIALPTGSPVTTGLGQLPDLRGIVLTQPRDDPRVVNALASDDGHPLLAHWFIGRGQAAAFTSDAHDWAREWVGTEEYARFWTQLARTIARPTGDRSADLTTQVVGDELVIRLDASTESGRPLDMLTVEGLLSRPDGSRADIRLEQVDPGGYELRVPATERGNYVVALSPRMGNRQLPVVVGGATRTTSPEYQQLTSNVGVMRDIAEAADGRLLSLTDPEGSGVFDREGMEPMRAASPIWPLLIAIAIGVFLADGWAVVTRTRPGPRRPTRGRRARSGTRTPRTCSRPSGGRGSGIRKRVRRRGGDAPSAPGS